MAEMKQFGIDLELDDAVAQGHYSNLAIISHSTSEFIIDFATVLPGVHMYFHVRSFVSGHGKVYAPTCLDMGTITHAME